MLSIPFQPLPMFLVQRGVTYHQSPASQSHSQGFASAPWWSREWEGWIALGFKPQMECVEVRVDGLVHVMRGRTGFFSPLIAAKQVITCKALGIVVY